MAETRPYSAEDFDRRFAERLAANRGAAEGDHSFNPDLADRFASIARHQAAVLIPVIDRRPEATLLFTVRQADLRSHAGQISFPGGRIDPGDGGPEQAALREAEEEIGLDPRFIRTIGLGPEYLTGSGYHVHPVLAIVRPDFTLSLNAAEVADVFEVPLSFLMDPTNHRQGSRVWDGVTRFFFEMPYQERHIWGITAGIVRVLYQRLYAESAEAAE